MSVRQTATELGGPLTAQRWPVRSSARKKRAAPTTSNYGNLSYTSIRRVHEEKT